MPKPTRNYFKAAKHDHRVAAQAFHFFDDDDRESIEVAFREVQDSARAIGGAISVYRQPKERGAWSRGRANAGVPVIGEGRGAMEERADGEERAFADAVRDAAAGGVGRAGLN